VKKVGNRSSWEAFVGEGGERSVSRRGPLSGERGAVGGGGGGKKKREGELSGKGENGGNATKKSLKRKRKGSSEVF